MTVGESIKLHRTKTGLTQKELSDKLCVSFQTVSKWENDTNEPDLSTLRKMSGIFGCSIDDLIDYKSEPVLEDKVEEAGSATSKIQVGVCKDCGKPLMMGDNIHHLPRSTPNGGKEVVDVCDACFVKHEETIKQRAQEINKSIPPTVTTSKKSRFVGPHDEKKVLIWSIIIGIAVFIAVLVTCIIYYQYVSIAGAILIPLVAGYATFADIYCIFMDSWIAEVFLEISSWSFHAPGIIFSFDLDGLEFLIVMKILFWVIGILFAVGVVVLACAISALCAIFTFPFLVILNH